MITCDYYMANGLIVRKVRLAIADVAGTENAMWDLTAELERFGVSVLQDILDSIATCNSLTTAHI
jgi:hypothetical protein